MSDPEVLALAAEQQRILVSHDVGTMPAHFFRFTNAGKHSCGVFLVSQSLDVGTAIEELLLIWLASEAVEWENRLVWRRCKSQLGRLRHLSHECLTVASSSDGTTPMFGQSRLQTVSVLPLATLPQTQAHRFDRLRVRRTQEPIFRWDDERSARDAQPRLDKRGKLRRS
jgi:hypothetical protein